MSWFRNLFDARRQIEACAITTIGCARTRLWTIGRRWNSPRFAPRSIPVLEWGQGPQMPAPCPNTPIPAQWRFSQRKVVVCSNERILG